MSTTSIAARVAITRLRSSYCILVVAHEELALDRRTSHFAANKCGVGHNNVAWEACSSVFADYKEKQLHGHDWQPFIDSLYWLTAALTTTGYGDIKPENQIEMVYACTIMVIGKMIVGYILGMVAATLANDESVRICFEQSVTVSDFCCRVSIFPYIFRCFFNNLFNLKNKSIITVFVRICGMSCTSNVVGA